MFTKSDSNCHKIFLFMLKPTEHEIYPAHDKILTIVGILTFMSRINTTSESYKARELFNYHHFFFNDYVQLEYYAQLT